MAKYNILRQYMYLQNVEVEAENVSDAIEKVVGDDHALHITHMGS